jgi:LPS export ABC transporter protein LptC
MRRAARLSLLAGSLMLALTGCRKAPPPQDPSAKAAPSLDLNGFHVRASHEGQLLWEARAVRARVFRQDQRAEAEDVTIVYYNHGRRVSTARADRARMDLKDYDVDAEGNVKLDGDNGVRLETPRLRWDNQAQRVSSASAVRLIRGGTVLTGVGFTADKDLHDVRVLNNVQAEAVSVRRLKEDAQSWPAPR